MIVLVSQTKLPDSSNPLSDIVGAVQGVPKYFIVTRQNVVADSFEYVIQEGALRGFSLTIEILPIADRSREAMLDIYNDKEDREKIEDIVKKYGGELQNVSYTPIGFTLVVSVYFPERDISDEKLKQLENELQHMMPVNVMVEQGGRLQLL